MDAKIKDIIVCAAFFLLLFGGLLLCILKPKPAYLDTERRSLLGFPELSADSVLNGRFSAGFESYAADNFPYRDAFRSVKALTAAKAFRQMDNNGIYASDGYLAAMEYPLNESSLDHAADRFRFVYETYLTADNHVYLSVIPDKNCFLAQKSGRLTMDYADFEKQMAQKADFAAYIPISDLLTLDDYYKTDTHWRQENIEDVAKRLLQAMGAGAQKEYERRTLTRDFYGVYYGQAALPVRPDKLSYLTGEDIEGAMAYDWQNGRRIFVYDLDRAAGKDPYEMFLSGPLSLITVHNPDAPKEMRLVMFRDSFGSSIAPLFIGSYSEITLVDIRYIHPNLLEKWIDFKGCDVLFLYSTLVLNHSETLK